MGNKWHRFKMAFWTKVAERKFKHVPTRDVKEYAITTYVDAKMTGNLFKEWATIKYINSQLRKLSND